MSAPAASASRSFSPRGQYQNDLLFAQTVRQNHRAANHLVGVLGVHAQAQGHVHRLIELGELDLLQQDNCVLERVRTRLYLGARLHNILS